MDDRRDFALDGQPHASRELAVPTPPIAGRALSGEIQTAVFHRPLACLAVLTIAALYAVRLLDGWQLAAVGMAVTAALVVVVAAARRRAIAAMVALLIACVLAWQVVREGPVLRVTDVVGRGVLLTGVVSREPVPRGDSVGFTLQVEEVRIGGRVRRARGIISVIAGRGFRAAYLDRLEVVGKPTEALAAGRSRAVRVAIREPRLVRNLGPAREGLVGRVGRLVRADVVEVLRPALPHAYRELHAQLLASLFLGTHGAGMPPAVVEAFRETGTVHVLVVSGTQISLLFTLVYLPGTLSRLRRQQLLRGQLDHSGRYPTGLLHGLPAPALVLIGLAVMCCYALLTQGGSPVLRAAVMAGLIAAGLLLRRVSCIADHHGLDFDVITALAVAVLSVLCADPEAVFDLGFQLSFAAVAGIALLGPPLRRTLGFLSDFWGYLLTAPVAAQLAILPIVAWHWGSAPVVGFVSNILVVPLAAALLWLGLLTFLVGSAWAAAAAPLGWLCGQLCWLMTRSIDVFSRLPRGVVWTGRVTLPAMVTYYTLTGVAIWLLAAWNRHRAPEGARW